MLLDLINYSLRNLWIRKLRSSLTMLGIIVGIASVIALIGLGNGLRQAVTSQFGSVSADLLTIQAGGIQNAGPPGTGAVNPLQKEYVEDLSKLPSVNFVAGRLVKSVKLGFNDREGISFLASLPDGEPRNTIYDIQLFKADSGRLLKDGDLNKIVLGYNFAKSSNGFERGIRNGDRVSINGKVFEVVGITKKKGSFIFDNVIWMNEEIARDLLDDTDSYNVIIARSKTLNSVEKTKADIERYLRKKRDVKVGEEDFNVQTAESAIKNVNSVLSGVQIFILIIASISMIVGAIGIINTMFTAVLERRREIGIMKAIGAKNSDIFALFFVESGIIGCIGGVIGIIIGSIMALMGTGALNALLGLEASPGISIVTVLLAATGSFLLGSLSGIIPAMQAANMPPVDALRT